MSHPEPSVNICPQGKAEKLVLILCLTAFDPIAEVATSPDVATRVI
jgi:hypothetical protein